MNFVKKFKNYRRYKQTVAELSRYSDRELNDMGIVRDDIHRLARKTI